MINHGGFKGMKTDKKSKPSSGLGGNGRTQKSMPVSKKTDPMHMKPKKRGVMKGSKGGR